MKSPEEIKKALALCVNANPYNYPCDECPYVEVEDEDEDGCKSMMKDALALIQQLEAENAELKRELGAAIMALATCAMDGLDGNICNYCTRKNCDEQDLHYECFEWRGPCEENGGVA